MNVQEPITRSTRKPRPEAQPATRTLNLALQGGGAHGAFTWGVLDRLLEDERVSFEGVAATSAGAMNAVVMAYGLVEGGREGARKSLTNFWRRVSHSALFSPLQPTIYDRVMKHRGLENSPAYLTFDLLTRFLSPYQFNPFNINPLRKALEQSVDLGSLREACCKLKLNICATNVRTGKVKVFRNDDLSIDAVMASACLPFLYRAVEIDGEAYWDGGYMGNPAIFPLIYHCDSADVLIIHVNPMNRSEVPTSAGDILNRVNEISFNSSLMREMRAIAFVTDLVDGGTAAKAGLKRMNIHAISADDVTTPLGVASKLNADWGFLTELRDAGRAHASRWLDANFDRIGKESTVDIRAAYL